MGAGVQGLELLLAAHCMQAGFAEARGGRPDLAQASGVPVSVLVRGVGGVVEVVGVNSVLIWFVVAAFMTFGLVSALAVLHLPIVVGGRICGPPSVGGFLSLRMVAHPSPSISTLHSGRSPNLIPERGPLRPY